MKNIKGPWYFNGCQIENNEDVVIAYVEKEGQLDKAVDKIGDLISSSPDLLFALEDALNLISELVHPNKYSIGAGRNVNLKSRRIAIRKVISKARGES